MIDQVKNTELDLKEYEDKKTYTSNVVDNSTLSESSISKVNSLLHYDETVSKPVIQPVF